MAFNKYWEEKQNYDKDHPVEMCRIIPHNSLAVNRSLFLQSIDNIGTMTDAELRKFIQVNFRVILQNVFYGNSPQQYLKAFTDRNFLSAFNDVITTFGFLERDDTIKLNTIAYHYLTLPDSQKSPEIVSKIVEMSKIVNRTQLPRLLGLGLSDNLATMLLIARNSDPELKICVKRVDFIIITQPMELMTEKMITEIFKILYDVFNIYSQVFQYIMLDVLPDNENDPNNQWITDEIQEVDSTLSLAALDILDNLPTETIKYTLINYAEGKRIVNPNAPVRFSMRKLADDYYRINDVIARLEYENGIIMP